MESTPSVPTTRAEEYAVSEDALRHYIHTLRKAILAHHARAAAAHYPQEALFDLEASAAGVMALIHRLEQHEGDAYVRPE